MNSRTHGGHLRRRTGVLLAAAALASSYMAFVASPVGAATPTRGASSDCFGGALSSDAIHCEVLEWAHNSGVIDVDGVYRAGRSLFIYLTQTDRLDDAALQKMVDKSREVARRTGEHDCVLNARLCGSGAINGPDGGYILPKSSVYQTVEVFVGGAEARRSSRGWRAFEQLWPQVVEGVGGAAGGDGDFDISGVDRTNFPTLEGNCDTRVDDDSYEYACRLWDAHPGLGFANVYDEDPYSGTGKIYAYVKAGVGEEAKIAAAKKALMNKQPEYYTEDRLEVVAVPHDFEELWRWSLVLDRFAESAGNTLGITYVELGFNDAGGLGKDRKYLFPLEDVPDLTDHVHERGGWPDGLLWRLTIWVATLEFEETVAALPRLLGQLEIPVSAVGLIYEEENVIAERGSPEPAEETHERSAGNAAQPETGAVVDSGPFSWWVWAASAGVLAAFGLVALLTARRRRAADGPM